MYTPLTSKTTVSSRNKMIAGLSNNAHSSTTAVTKPATAKATTTSTTASRLPPGTTFKPPPNRTEKSTATASRIAQSRSRLSGNSVSAATTAATPAVSAPRQAPSLIAKNGRESTEITNHRMPSTTQILRRRIAGHDTANSSKPASFQNSRSSSKLSSVSSIVNNGINHNNNVDQSSSRQSSLTSNAIATVRKHNTIKGSTIPSSNYIPDTNTIRKGLAKFSNPIECQRQFQTLNSKIRELEDIIVNKEETIANKDENLARTQDHMNEVISKGVGYAIVVQYFSQKLKLDTELDLEQECKQLKSEIERLRFNEQEFDQKLNDILEDNNNRLKVEIDLRTNTESELEELKVNHSNQLVSLKEEHEKNINDLKEEHSDIREKLESRIQLLESDLNTRTKELQDLKKEHDTLYDSYNKLEDSLTKDKDARVKYAQEKAIQLQKDVDSLNSVLEMRTERIHVLEKDSILLSEVQHDLMKTEDSNKALKQQVESLKAVLENKRVQYENLLADHEKVAQELKRERKERRRMTMRSEQLEYVLNESCSGENNVTVLDASVET